MTMEQQAQMKALLILVNAGHAGRVVEVARAAGAHGATILNARGEGAEHKVFMGITVDSEKEIILCLVDRPTAEAVMDAVREHAGLHTLAHAICLTLPVDRFSGEEGVTPDKKA